MSNTETKLSVPRRWFNPVPMSTLRQEMDNLMENFFGTTGLAEVVHANTPSLDVAETDTAIEVTTDVPGYKVEEIHIDIGDGYLTISGEHKEEAKTEGNGKKYLRVERRMGQFSRSIALTCSVKEDKVKAELKDGVLSIVLPKSDESRRRHVTVKAVS
jgi:HSP20 family protein